MVLGNFLSVSVMSIRKSNNNNNRIPSCQIVNETDFWSRYFNSRLWERHRASVRSSKQGTAKADDMFDKYLEAPDDGAF